MNSPSTNHYSANADSTSQIPRLFTNSGQSSRAPAPALDVSDTDASDGLLFDFSFAADYDFTSTLPEERPSPFSHDRASAPLSDSHSPRGSLSIDKDQPLDPHECDSPLSAPTEDLHQLTLGTPAPLSIDLPESTSAPSSSRRDTEAFTAYRSSSQERPHSASSPDSAADVPPKRARILASAPPSLDAPRPQRAVDPGQGIQPHPAHPISRKKTPRHYVNEFAHLHPWGRYVEPRPDFTGLSEATVTADAPLHVYRQIPDNGYFASRFARSLFPRRFVGTPSPTNKVPLLELMRLRDIIAFRQQAVRLTITLIDYRYRDDSDDIARIPRTPPGVPPSLLFPPADGDGIRPVLYQVVSRGYGQGVILEAKDFFIPGPDHPELQCLPLTQESVNYLTPTRGFDRSYVSVKDFVWVLSLRPTPRALNAWDRQTILERARLPRPSVLESRHPYFLQVHEFILVTPSRAQRNILGMVVTVNRRGRNNHVSNLHVAFEGCQEALRISASLCDFPLDQVEREDLLLAEARANVSCSMRFSHWPVSLTAQRHLTNAIRRFLPAYPEEAILPLHVTRITDEDRHWVEDRLGDFSGYGQNPDSARHQMGKFFAAASAALSAQARLGDDKSTHETTAFVPSIDAIPLRLQFELHSMSTEGGWSRSRPADVWIVDSTSVIRTHVAQALSSAHNQTLRVELHSDRHLHRRLCTLVRRYCTINGDQGTANVRICVRLGRIPSGTDPVFELLASETLSAALQRGAPTMANNILDLVYGSGPRPERHHHLALPPSAPNLRVRLRASEVQLRTDQATAVQMGSENLPILAIQAAYGTGKTVVGALVAARLATAGNLVIATATTNVAVAQFTDTLLGLDDYRDQLRIIRFVADSALRDGAPTTSVDLHRTLQDLLVLHSASLSARERDRLHEYSHGRRLVEQILLHPESTLHLTDEEYEEYRIAENHNSEATERAVAILLRVHFPSVMCMTVSSLLNSTKPGGLFHDALASCTVIIGDEASQLPEPAFVALTTRFPLARHIYIGDVFQLEPHVRCPRSSLAARLGGRGIMDLLYRKDVPLAPLLTTFRAHPALNELPNILVYDGALISGTPAHHRSLMVDRLTLPNPAIPFVMVTIEGRSRLSPTQSYSNDDEAHCCAQIVQSLIDKDIPSTSIGIITFYKDQQRLIERTIRTPGIHLHTVDSVQGREMDIVLILTTRSDIAPSAGEFIDDLKRMNVAVTRSRHGQFLLGNVKCLRSLPNWGRLLQWATTRDVVVNRSTLPDIFA